MIPAIPATQGAGGGLSAFGFQVDRGVSLGDGARAHRNGGRNGQWQAIDRISHADLLLNKTETPEEIIPSASCPGALSGDLFT